MRILVTGATGYVGGMVMRHLGSRHEVIGVSSHGDEAAGILAIDLGSLDACLDLAGRTAVDVVVNAAGYKDVQGCENAPLRAYLRNTQLVANLCRAYGERARVIHISTDYVFDGVTGGWLEDAPLSPRTVYGDTKAAGELIGRSLCRRFQTIRLAAIYDLRSPFLRFLLKRFAAGETAGCYVDARYSPTYYRDFLDLLDALLADGDERPPRLFHSCGPALSRYEFAVLTAEAFGFDPGLVLPEEARAAGGSVLSDLSLRSSVAEARYGLSARPHREALNLLRSA